MTTGFILVYFKIVRIGPIFKIALSRFNQKIKQNVTFGEKEATHSPSSLLFSVFTAHVTVNFDSRVDAFRIDDVNLTDGVTPGVQVCTVSGVIMVTLAQQGKQEQ